MKALGLAALVAACGSKSVPATKEPAPAAQPDHRGAEALGRAQFLEAKVIKLEAENKALAARLDVLVSRAEMITAGAPETSNTLAKMTRRHELLLKVLDYAESTKSNWWCGPFVCFRTESMCNVVEEQTSGTATADKCIARRRVYCRGFGKPFVGDRKADKNAMTCHALLSTCERIAASDGGGACLGVE